MSVYIRRLSIAEVHQRQRARHAAEIARHNAHVVDELDLEAKPSKRDQVLAEFGGLTRRWAR